MYALRGKRVAQMISRLEEDEIILSASDEAMLCAYVRGTICGRDLLMHATQFTDFSSYQDWLLNCLNESSQANVSEVSVEQLVRELEIGFRRGSERNRTEVKSPQLEYQAAIELLVPFRLGARRCMISTD